MKKSKKLIALVLVACMIIPTCITAYAEEEPEVKDQVNLVCVGDSMAQGYMFTDYQEGDGHPSGINGSSERAYYFDLKKEIEETYGEGSVKMTDLTAQGLEPDTLWEMLDPVGFEKSGIGRTAATERHIKWWTKKGSPYANDKEMAEHYKEEIEAADIITYDIGVNYFGNSLTDRIAGALDEYGVADDTFERLIGNPNGLNAKLVKSMRESLNALFADFGLDTATKLVDAFLNSYVSFLVYTDKAIDAIYKINPDVDLIVMPVYNPHPDLTIDVKGIKLHLSKAVDLLMDSLNNYLKYQNDHCGVYKLAEYDGTVVSFADELYYYEGEPSLDLKCNLTQWLREILEVDQFDAIFEHCLTGGKSTNVKKTVEAVFKAKEPNKTQKEIVEKVNYCIEVFRKACTFRSFTLDDIISRLSGDSDVDITKPFTSPDTATDTEYMALHGRMRIGADARGFASHPCPEGLKVKARAAIEAYYSDRAANGRSLERHLYIPLEGYFELSINSIKRGVFKFEKEDGKWFIKNSDGKYVGEENGRVVLSDTPFAWKYSLGTFYHTDETTKTVNIGLLIKRSYETKSINTYYLSTVKEGSKLSEVYTIDQLSRVINHDWKYTDNGNGTHTVSCLHCYDKSVESHVYDAEGKCVCGATKEVVVPQPEPTPDAPVAPIVTVDINTVTTGWIIKTNNYVAKISAEGNVKKIEYSVNGLLWAKDDTYTSLLPISKLKIRVTDTDGKVWTYNYVDGVVTQK